MSGPGAIRRVIIAEYWRTRVPTSEIAAAMGIDEAEVCAIVEDIETSGGKDDVRQDASR